MFFGPSSFRFICNILDNRFVWLQVRERAAQLRLGLRRQHARERAPDRLRRRRRLWWRRRLGGCRGRERPLQRERLLGVLLPLDNHSLGGGAELLKLNIPVRARRQVERRRAPRARRVSSRIIFRRRLFPRLLQTEGDARLERAVVRHTARFQSHVLLKAERDQFIYHFPPWLRGDGVPASQFAIELCEGVGRLANVGLFCRFQQVRAGRI